MHIYCLGLNHTTAPIELRERLDFGEETLQTALMQLSSGNGPDAVTELIILSTCNRVELYAVSSRSAFDELETFLSRVRGFPIAELHFHSYQLMDTEAVEHLMLVASGLDSLVVGEPQILGQVTRALELAREQGAVGPLLNRLFQAAIHAGKRARSETEIGRNPASVPSLAASLCERAHPHLQEARVVVLGAGEMAELAVEGLRKRGVQKLLVINRTHERAQSLARRWDAETATFDSIQDALAQADILIASTGAPYTLISADMVRTAMDGRPHRSLVLIDIAVPRDIDPGAAQISGVRLYDIDNLNGQLEKSLAGRKAEVPRVKAILREELAGFMEFMDSLEVLPVITGLREQAETIRQMELEKTLRHLPSLSTDERSRIEAMTQALVRKLLESPTRHLRAEASTPRASEYVAMMQALFDLESGPRAQAGPNGSESGAAGAD